MNSMMITTHRKRDVECCDLVLVSDSTLPKADQMRVGKTLCVELADGSLVIIPKGFVTDLFSVPPWLHTLFKPYDNRLNLAAVVHDWLYEQWEQTGIVSENPRLYADRAMLEIMLRYRRNHTLYAFYYAVRIGGGKNWNYYRNRNKNEEIV